MKNLGYTTKSGIEISDEMVRMVMIPKEYFGAKEIKTENPFTSISVSVTDVMIDTLSNDSELGAYVRGLLNRTR